MTEAEDLNALAGLERIRSWLRFHDQHQLRIDPWGLYGCWVFTLSGPDGEQISTGKTLLARVRDVEGWTRQVDARG